MVVLKIKGHPEIAKLGKRINRRSGAVVLGHAGRSVGVLISKAETLLVNQFVSSGMNRSGIKKLYKRIFKSFLFVEVDAKCAAWVASRMPLDASGASHPVNFDDVAKSGEKKRTYGLFPVDYMNLVGFTLRYKSKSFTEKLVTGVWK